MVQRRSGMSLLYVGDVGVVVAPSQPKPVPQNINVDEMSWRELFLLAIELGHDVKQLLGIQHCYEHINMILLKDNKLPDGFNYAEDTAWCRSCFQWFRQKKKVQV